MTVKTCKDCHFSRPANEGVIMCMRFPPQVTNVSGATVSSHSPLLTETWWCGEWKQRTNGGGKPLTRQKTRSVPAI